MKDVTIFIGYESFLDDVPAGHSFFPANGGCRIFNYSSEDDAINECRELNKVMSLKHNVFLTGFSGGKTVISCRNHHNIDRRLFMHEICNALSQSSGRFLTGCDLNTSVGDMKLLSGISQKVQPERVFVLAATGLKCDPEKATAFGVVAAVQELSEFIEPNCELFTVLFLGIGKVGSHVATILDRMPKFQVLVANIHVGRACSVVPHAIDLCWKD